MLSSVAVNVCVLCGNVESLVPNVVVELNFTLQLLTTRSLSSDVSAKGQVTL